MSGKLARYRAKRSFDKTREPRGGGAVAAAPFPRFIIQKHAARHLHYDLRLEMDGVLRSWALTRGPALAPGEKRLAVEVEDHPLEYGDFEGTIPRGEYGGGTVMLWDRGFWQSEGEGTPAEQLSRGELKLVLAGEKLVGSWVLVRLKHDRESGGANQSNWLMIRHADGAEPLRVTRQMDDCSVASGRRMADIARGAGPGPEPFITGGRARAADAVWSSSAGKAREGKKRKPLRHDAAPRRVTLPEFIPPQLCRTCTVPPSGKAWVHEVKLDGYRMQLRVEDGHAVLRTRSGLDWTDRFAAIATAAARLPDAMLDGEVVALDREGRPDFGALQAALSEGRSDSLVYFAFDLLFAGGMDMRPRALAERKSRLKALLAALQTAQRRHLRPVDHIAGAARDIYRSACDMGLEGIVSKRLDSVYRSGRSGNWTKSKCRPGQEVVIGGWSGGDKALRSLIVGVHKDGELVHTGRVGTGFNAQNARDLLARLRPLATGRSPFGGGTAPRKQRDTTWVEPRLVAEIEFAGWTSDGLVRQAAFKGLRRDKPAEDVEADPPGGVAPLSPVRSASSSGATVLDVTLSHPDKALWPATSATHAVIKLELARYYEQLAPIIMAHIRGRPCSVVRTPDGIGGQQFFQRHVMAGQSPLVTHAVVSGDRKPYVQLDRPEALIAMAQMAAVELHPWNCAPGAYDTPGRLVFDLDPGPGVPFTSVMAAAKELRERLEALGLVPFCKTTGGKGLHVVTPLEVRVARTVTWPEAKTFAQTLCSQMAADSPDRYLIKMTKRLRDGRIFLDYLRNDRMSTAVAPLSPRARPGATVSMPLTWGQVRAGLDPQRFTIATAPDLVAKSPAWRDYERSGRDLRSAMARLVRTS